MWQLAHLQALVLSNDVGQTLELLPYSSIVRAGCCGDLRLEVAHQDKSLGNSLKPLKACMLPQAEVQGLTTACACQVATRIAAGAAALLAELLTSTLALSNAYRTSCKSAWAESVMSGSVHRVASQLT